MPEAIWQDDEWDAVLLSVEKQYGTALRDRLDYLIDLGEIPLVNLIISKL
jgi:hypothetical protein